VRSTDSNKVNLSDRDIYIYIYIYIEREREREEDTYISFSARRVLARAFYPSHKEDYKTLLIISQNTRRNVLRFFPSSTPLNDNDDDNDRMMIS
jgi:hypothetical protein